MTSTRYCPDCGTGHECDQQAGGENSEVAIARLQANRDIEVAKITARAGVRIADSEAAQEAAHAEGIVEGVEAAVDAATPDLPETGAPIVIPDAGPDPEPEPELTPPEVTIPSPGESGGKGWWDGYR